MTKETSFKILIILILTFAFLPVLFLSSDLTFKKAEVQAVPYREFKCKPDETSCKGEIWVRNCDTETSPECPNPVGHLRHTCEDYQICNDKLPGNIWRIRAIVPLNWCECKGYCLDDSVRDGSSDWPESGIRDGIDFVDPNNVFLPAWFDWLPVDGAKSYWWRATPLNPSANTQTVLSPVINKLLNPNNPPTEYTPDSCSLQSVNFYNWKVRSCCNVNGTECRTWLSLPNWSFLTNLAPEPATPTDPDWNNEADKTEGVEIPVTLDWCDSPDNIDWLGEGAEGDYFYDEGRGENVTNYRLKFYLVDADGNEVCHPATIEPDEECGYKEIIKGSNWPFDKLYSIFEDAAGQFFTENEEYRRKVAICYMGAAGEEFCSDYSQKWGFTTGALGDIEFRLILPIDDPANQVGLPLLFRWINPVGINSFRYQIKKVGIPIFTETTDQDHVMFDFPDLDLDALYTWKVQPCTDYEANPANCKDWIYSPLWQFKTTGAPPIRINPNNGALNEIIPVKLDWEDVSGAKSYRYKITGGGDTYENLVSISEDSLGYPDLKMNTLYAWKVQTCADEGGTVCGIFNLLPRTFRTFQMGAPFLIFPGPNEVIEAAGNINFSWQELTGASAYQYEIIYIASGEKIIDRITFSNSVSPPTTEFIETGLYKWRVRGCLDSNCIEPDGTGPWSAFRTFDLKLIAPAGQRGGLVPCGRRYDDPNTPWNEREPCQIKHLFLLIRNGLDFVLWKVGTILLVLLLIAAAAIFYLSRGDARTIFKIKSFLRSVIIGYVIILFAWFIINLILALAGFNFQFFGHWWELKF